MDKLKWYNQKLLAVIGTTLLAVIGISILIGIGTSISSFFYRAHRVDNGLQTQANDGPNNADTVFIRTQEITFDDPVQLDTAKDQYIFPVRQVNLEVEEAVYDRDKKSYGSFGSKMRYESYHGLYNNFVYYHHSKNLKHKIFNERITVTHWAHFKKDSIDVLLFKGTTTDDNSDGKMNYADCQSLFAYYVSNDTLMRYDFDGNSVMDFDPMKKTELISIKIGIDKNKDFHFDQNHEPQEIKTLNLVSREVSDMIPAEMKQSIQDLVDGVKK